MASNANDRGYIRTGTLAPCDCDEACAGDPIRAALVAGGVSANDLARYDAAGINGYVALHGFSTVAQYQALRNAALAQITGAYRIGATDTVMATTSTNNGSQQLSGVDGTQLATGRLAANTAAVFVFINIFNGATNKIAAHEPRKGTHTYTTTAATNIAGTFGVWTGPLISDTILTGTPIVCYVFKRPTLTEAVDRNTAMWADSNIGMVSGTNQIGSSRTKLDSSNIFARQWQIIAANPTAWAC